MGLNSCLIYTILCLNWFCPVDSVSGTSCSSPKLSPHSKIVEIIEPAASDETFPEGVVVRFACDPGYELFGSANTTCSSGEWLTPGPDCFLEVAEGSRCHMSPQADEFASAHFAADGDHETCVSFSSDEKHLVWAVDTFQAFRVRAVTILTQYFLPNSTIEIRVGQHHPSTGAKFNMLCTRQNVMNLQENHSQFYCDNVRDAPVGRFVSIAIEEPGSHRVSFCEVGVYSDSGLSVEDSCSDRALVSPNTARFVFENQCVQFFGEHPYSKAVEICHQHGATPVKPTSRALQNFLDFNVMRYVEKTIEEVIVSFWIDAKRSAEHHDWTYGNGSRIERVQIQDDDVEDCLVSEIRRWHAEPCGNTHRVICISAPVSCGTPGLPEHSSVWNRTKLPVNHFLPFNCESGFNSSVSAIRCLPNGSLSKEPTCFAPVGASIGCVGKIKTYLRSFSILADLPAWALNALIAALSVLSASLAGAISLCCFCILKRQRDSKLYRFQIADF